MIIKYSSWLPGIAKSDTEEFILPEGKPFLLADLKEILATRKQDIASIFSHKEVIFAYRNGEVLKETDILYNRDTITFFSPIAGG